MRLDLTWRAEDGLELPMALWYPGPGYRMISTGVLGGGLGPREWVLNAQVPAAAQHAGGDHPVARARVPQRRRQPFAVFGAPAQVQPHAHMLARQE